MLIFYYFIFPALLEQKFPREKKNKNGARSHEYSTPLATLGLFSTRRPRFGRNVLLEYGNCKCHEEM